MSYDLHRGKQLCYATYAMIFNIVTQCRVAAGISLLEVVGIGYHRKALACRSSVCNRITRFKSRVIRQDLWCKISFVFLQ